MAVQDEHGRMHQNQQEADKANQEYRDSNFVGQSGGVFILILTIGPVIAAAIGGFLFGILFKLGTVGRAIQSVIVSLVFGIVSLIAVDMFTRLIFNTSVSINTSSLSASILALIPVVAVLIVTDVWYFRSLYPIFKSMGTIIFAMLVKNTFCFGWFGGIASIIIGFFNKSATTPIMIGSLAAGAIYFVVKILSNSEAGKEEKAQLPKARIAELISIACVLLILVGVIGKSRADYERRENKWAASHGISRNHKQIITDLAKNAATQRVTVVVVSEYSSEQGTPISPKAAGPGRGENYWDTVVKWVKKGDTLTITGEVVDAGLGYFVVPVEHQGAKGYIDIDYINIPDGN